MGEWQNASHMSISEAVFIYENSMYEQFSCFTFPEVLVVRLNHNGLIVSVFVSLRCTLIDCHTAVKLLKKNARINF